MTATNETWIRNVLHEAMRKLDAPMRPSVDTVRQLRDHRRDLTLRSSQVRSATIDEATRSVEAIIATETPVEVFDWQRFVAIDEIIVLRGMEFGAQVPLLDSHVRMTSEDVHGSVRDIRVEPTPIGNALVARLFFDEDEASQRIWGKVSRGHLRDVSVGYQVRNFVDIPPGQTQDVGGVPYTATPQRALRVSVMTTLKETSVTPVGADTLAKIRSYTGRRARRTSRHHSEEEDRDMPTKRSLKEEIEALLAGDSDEEIIDAGLRQKLLEMLADGEVDDVEGDDRQIEGETEPGEEPEMADAGGDDREDGEDDEEDRQDLLMEEEDEDDARSASVKTRKRRRSNGEKGGAESAGQRKEDGMGTKGTQADRKRAAAIFALNGPRDLERKAIEEGWSVEKFGSECYKAERGDTPSPVPGGAPAVHTRSAEKDITAIGLSAGLMARMSGSRDKHAGWIDKDLPDEYVEEDINGRKVVDPFRSRKHWERAHEQAYRFRHFTMLDTAKECLRLHAQRTGDRVVIPHNRMDMIRAAVSTADFANVLNNVVNKELQVSFDTASMQDSRLGWVRFTDVPDYKLNERPRVGPASDLKKLPKGGEAEDATASDLVERFRVHDFARKFSVSNQDLVNDDLNVFQDMPQKLGQAAFRVELDLTYFHVKDNAVLIQDNTAWFDTATHANLNTGAALADATLEAGIQAFAVQTEDGVIIDVRPEYLVVPKNLLFTARKLIEGSTVVITGSTSDVRTDANVLSGIVQLRSEARLDTVVVDPITGGTAAADLTSWYLFGADNMHPSIEFAYLQGMGRRPQIRSYELDKGRYGRGWDILHTVGVKSLAFQSAQKNTA